MADMQWHVHKGRGGPVLVQYSLPNQQQLELWVNPPSIAEGGFIVNEVFNDSEYLKHGVNIKPGDTIVDVGANIGIFGARVLSVVPGGDVTYIGIEPCPATFQLLRQNLLGTDSQGEQNSVFHINEQLSAIVQECHVKRSCSNYPDNIHLVQTAVSATQGTCSMTYFPNMPGNSTMRPEEKQQLQQNITPPKFMEGAQTLEVPKTTLSALLADMDMAGPINLLKIDVEGEELEVLRGLDDACWARVQQIALEVHDCIDEPLHAGPSAALTDAAAAAAAAAADANGIVAGASAAETGGTPSTGLGAQQPLNTICQQQQQQQQEQERPAAVGAAAAATGLGRFPRLQAAMARLPGPRTCKDIDGVQIRYHALPVRIPGQPPPEMDPAKAAASAEYMLPPPRDEGRVMVVAMLLRDQGFRVVVECSLGLPLNYSVYGVRHASVE